MKYNLTNRKIVFVGRILIFISDKMSPSIDDEKHSRSDIERFICFPASLRSFLVILYKNENLIAIDKSC